MFGLGWAELLVLGMCGVVVIGGAVIAIIVSLTMGRRSSNRENSGDAARLRAEIHRLRDEIERLRDEIERLKKGPDASTGITSAPQ